MEDKKLEQKKCSACSRETGRLTEERAQILLQKLGEGWQIVEGRYLEKIYDFPNFEKALSFANKIGELSEVECHHPDLYISYGKLKISLWTHKIGGLSENDFILAAKCDLLPRGLNA